MSTHTNKSCTTRKQDAIDPAKKEISAPSKNEPVVEPPPVRPSPTIGDPPPEPTPKPNIETPIVAVDSKDAANSEPQAAKGNDEVMSEPPPKTTVVDVKADTQSKWKNHVGSAKQLWSKISETDLLKTEDDKDKLATLLQNRHDMARAEAYRQVSDFLKRNSA